jgi:hypothetical protein
MKMGRKDRKYEFKVSMYSTEINYIKREAEYLDVSVSDYIRYIMFKYSYDPNNKFINKKLSGRIIRNSNVINYNLHDPSAENTE